LIRHFFRRYFAMRCHIITIITLTLLSPLLMLPPLRWLTLLLTPLFVIIFFADTPYVDITPIITPDADCFLIAAMPLMPCRFLSPCYDIALRRYAAFHADVIRSRH